MGLPVLDDAKFKAEVLDASTPVVVDFMAEWCGPCKGVAKALETLQPEYEGRVKFVKVDIDQAPNTAVQYQITAVPQVFVFRGGEPAGKMIGAAPDRKIREFIDTNTA